MKNSKRLFESLSIMTILVCSTYSGTAQNSWLLTGNSGTNPSVNFIGNIDSMPLRFRVKNIPAGELNYINGNTAFGINTLLSNKTGTGNVAIGGSALYHNTKGRNLVAVGDSALFNYTGAVIFSNTAIGSKALFSTTSGYRNTATGFQALYSDIKGFDNTAIGSQALYSNTTVGNTTGRYNTAIGSKALYANTSGYSNTAIGAYADVGSNNLFNATAIGAYAIVSTSNSLILGNGANVGIGTSAPNTKLQVNGGYIRITEAEAGTNLRLGGLYGTTGIWSDAGALNIGAIDNNPIILQASGSATGNVGIGTVNPAYKLSVNGTIQAKEILVQTGWSDYVFNKDYKLRSLNEVENYIAANKHLPDVPSANEVKDNGIKVAQMDSVLIKKVEELTLYVIHQNKQIQQLQQKVIQLEKGDADKKN